MPSRNFGLRRIAHASPRAAFALLLCAFGTAHAEKMPLDIGAGKAVTTLSEFIRQTGLQLLFDADSVGSKTTAPVRGSYEPREAIEIMLKGSGLQFDFVNEKTIAVSAGKISARTSSTTTAFTPSTTESDANATGPTLLSPEPVFKLDEVVVTGTHIRGEAPIGSQLITIDREYIERSGYATVQDVLQTLPQAAPGPSEDNPEGGPKIIGNPGVGAGINLRGLGVGATLVLVNGMRQPSSGTLGAFVDISNIPIAAVERIEVLPDGASALYGSDAIGGVVNIILRKNYSGAETRVRTGSFGGDAQELQISQLFGRTWSRGNMTLGYERYERGSVDFTDRSYSANSDQRPNGGDDFSTNFGNPGNILCPFGIPSCVPFQPAYAIPEGQDGRALEPGDLLPGVVNRENINEGRQLLVDNRMDSAFLEASHRPSDRLELFANARFSRRPMSSRVTPSAVLNVPAANPYFVDPFGGSSSIFMFYTFSDDVVARSTGQTDTYSSAFGASLRFARTWRTTWSASYAQQNLRVTQTGIDPAEALAQTDPALAFNPFGDNNATSAEVLRSMIRVAHLSSTSRTLGASLAADGTVLTLPGGELKLAAGLDYRSEKLDTQHTDTSPRTDLERSNRAIFGELRIPIVGEPNARVGMRALLVSLAARHESYDDWGDSTTPKLGITWAPAPAWRVNGTFGLSFRSPTLAESDDEVLFPPAISLDAFFFDPSAPGQSTPALILFGTNPELREERGKQWTLGLDYEPERIPGLSASLTYFSNEYRDRVGVGGTPGREVQILAEEALWADIIHRNPSQQEVSTLCHSPGFTNTQDPSLCDFFPPRVIVDFRSRNIAFSKVAGLDLAVRHLASLSSGTLDVGMAASYAFHNEFALSQEAERVDILDTVGNPLSWRLRATASWAWNRYEVHAVASHVPGYDDPLSGLSLDRRQVGSWTTLDLGANYFTNADGGWFSDLRLMLNVNNAFDEDPPFVNLTAGYDAANADPYGRVLSFAVSKSW
jgi:iron complex outermembrane receptor protein